MLCPEVTNFPPPKVLTSSAQHQSMDPVFETINMNNFYKSLIITCPDELQTPRHIEEDLTDLSEYYKIRNCSLSEFTEPVFIENFVKKGKLSCLSAERNCVVDNCAAVTPDGVLTLHLLEYIFQTIGLEGRKQPNNYYEVKIYLKTLKSFQKLYEKVRKSLSKLEQFDFYISWEPESDNVCPSSIAKYFCDRKINVSLQKVEITRLQPEISEIPSLKDVDVEEMVEWIGMLAHNGDLYQKETYISTYDQPTDSGYALKSSRISLLIVKGFFTPPVINKVCQNLKDYVTARDLDNYWASISIQSYEDSVWQWNRSSPRMFQAHDSTCNVFFTHHSQTVYSIGQLKYS